MLFNLLRWLDASPAHYWLVAWSAFGSVVALALVAVCFPRAQAWWQHPIIFSAAMLIVLLSFRWPLIFDNRQYPDPDESQFIAGALTLRHDPVFWRSVDGTTHGPLVQWPLLVASFVRGSLDFTTARIISTLLIWIGLVSAWLIFRHLYTASLAGILVLPLLAENAFTQAWSFVAYCSEHVPDALLAVACWLLLTGWRQPGAGPPNFVRLFSAGVLLGAVPFAKLQAAPIAAGAFVAGMWLVSFSDRPRCWSALRALFSGSATIPVIIIGTVLVCGAWSDFFRSYILDNIRYVGRNSFPPDRSFTLIDTPRMLVELGAGVGGFNSFFLWMVGLGASGLLTLRWFTSWHRRCAAFATAVLLLAVFAAMAPGRPYMHYLQLLVFPTGLFGGVIAGAVLRNVICPNNNRPAVARVLRSAFLAAFLICALLPQVWWRAHEPQPFVGQFTATQGALAQSEVSREILRHANPGERLGMWGWMPIFWAETGLIQATRDGNDSRQIEPHAERDYYRARFLRDLVRSRPPVFIDAVGPGNFVYEDRAQDAHETFPELRDHIANNYHLVRDIEGSRVYVRNDRL